MEEKKAEKKAEKPVKIKWKKPSGSTIETNDYSANVEAAEKLGWKRVK